MSTGSRTRVLIAGAGVAGVETALALRAFAGDRVEVELLDPAVELTLAAEFNRPSVRAAPPSRSTDAARPPGRGAPAP